VRPERSRPLAPRRAALSVAAFAAALVALAAAPHLAASAASAAGRLAASAATTSAALALCAVGGAALAREPIASRLGLGTTAANGFGARRTALAVVGFLALSQTLDTILALAGLRERSVLARFDEAIAGAGPGELALLTLALGVGPGIAEELFSRGWIQRGFARRMRPTAAVALAAAIFGALHVDLVHAASAFALGLCLGWLAWASDGIRVPVVCHVANNLAALATSRLGWTPASAETPGPAVALVLALGLGASALALRAAWRGARAP
jgi:membrane protease YdiL (CAAX protease family)